MFTDRFVKKPVLAVVVSLLILFLGLRSIADLPLRQFPELTNTVITVTTTYPGANADLIQGFITSPLQKSIASADGIDYLTAESSQNASIIKANIKLGFDPQKAFTNIMSKVSEVEGQLPRESNKPIVQKETGNQIALMYISFDSDKMSPQQITDYISRVVQPKIETTQGVASAQILGDSSFAMRIWLNPIKMAALDVSTDELINALKANNFQSTAGQTKGLFIAKSLNAQTGLHTVENFQQLVIKSSDNSLVRLQDVAKVELGSANYDASVTFNGRQAIFVAVNPTPSANPLTVITKVRKLLPSIEKEFPPSLHGVVVYDATSYIRASIKEVASTIIEATLIVILVIYLFLGSLRSVFIPVVTIPLSLIGVCTFMLFLGYSINLLTLLAMVLAIGLVVDDAIVVVENIHRHIEEGLKPVSAAIKGAREIALPVVSMTITLAAVYAPIGFMTGLTGALFKEFAFTLASAVIISGVIALTLSPMMCSKLLTSDKQAGRFALYIDKKFAWLQSVYERRLTGTLRYPSVIAVFAITVLTSCYFLYNYSQQELAPQEDQSALFISATAPQYANIDYVTSFTAQFDKLFNALPATENYFIVNGMGAVNNVIAGLILKPWDQRSMTQDEVKNKIQQELGTVAGLSSVIFPLPSLPISGGLPIEFVITTTSSPELLYQASQRVIEKANASGLFIFTDLSLKFNKPELVVDIDRAKAGQLGISMQSLGNALAVAYGGNYINRFSMQGRSYEVVPQVERRFRLDPQAINFVHVKTASGQLVPLSTVVSIRRSVQPNKLSQFQKLNAATVQGMMRPGVSLGEALSYLETTAKTILPEGMSYDFAGTSRRYIQESGALIFTLFFAIVVIFLVLAAQFESFKDALCILFTVPMSICGALIPLNLGLATVNIYTQIGLVTLVGLISKHGILMIDFAKQLRQQEDLSLHEAIIKAASIRLRPILMTTAAMVFGVMPLILASGAGAVSRQNLGLVIASGMLIGTAFTLFVLPTLYILISQARSVVILSGFAALALIALVAHSLALPVSLVLAVSYVAIILLLLSNARRVDSLGLAVS